MRLSEFILANLEKIVTEWVVFAGTILREKHFDDAALRDDAAGILKTIAREMETDQSDSQQAAKSQGLAPRTPEDTSAETHSLARLGQGFNQVQVEFRALRATVIRLWLDSSPELDNTSMYQLTRFNEGIDQAVCESAAKFMKKIEESTDFAVAVLAHDLRNPLNAIMSAAQLVDASTSIDRATLNKVAGNILESGKHMTRLINNLLDFTRTRLGQALPIKKMPIDLGTVCRKAIAEIAVAHPDRTIQLNCPQRLFAHGDGTRIGQMVSNLVANAVHHGDPRTPVTVEISPDDGNVTFHIHNEGIPIEESALATIFDAPSRPKKEDEGKNEYGHLGIGLFVVRKIVEAHSGTVSVSSTPAHGTTFVVSLPRQENANS